MTENEFLLQDRITKIRSVNEKYNLEDKSYISFSGGKDSSVLSKLFDLAIPGNSIPRVFINTGIEYNMIVDFVKDCKEHDERIIIIKPSQDIKHVLEKYGYPFKSKEHSQKVSYYQNGGLEKTVVDYLGRGDKKTFTCPKKLEYNFTPEFTLKVSDKCCYKLKKEPADSWSSENKKPVAITGMRKNEGGIRRSIKSCTVFYDDECKELKKFHPLLPVNDDFINWFIKSYNVNLCCLYSPPYNFKRTGCKGCPYSTDLKKQLEIMKNYLPAERKQCETIWKPVYEEYRLTGYRLEKSLYGRRRNFH